MIELDHVTTGYGTRRQRKIISEDLSLKILPGQITVLLGPNGCGKSTLLRTAAGLQKPLEGKILWDHKNMAGARLADLARQRAFLPQTREIPPLTVREMVLSSRYSYTGPLKRLREEDFQRAEEAIGQMGMTPWADTRLTELSGGQQQRAYLAMMICQDAPALILDEPLAGLDIDAIYDITRHLEMLRQEGHTVLLSLHDLEVGFRLADRLILMDKKGVIREEGTPAELAGRQAFRTCFHVRAEQVRCSEGIRTIFCKEDLS